MCYPHKIPPPTMPEKLRNVTFYSQFRQPLLLACIYVCFRHKLLTMYSSSDGLGITRWWYYWGLTTLHMMLLQIHQSFGCSKYDLLQCKHMGILIFPDQYYRFNTVCSQHTFKLDYGHKIKHKSFHIILSTEQIHLVGSFWLNKIRYKKLPTTYKM